MMSYRKCPSKVMYIVLYGGREPPHNSNMVLGSVGKEANRTGLQIMHITTSSLGLLR